MDASWPACEGGVGSDKQEGDSESCRRRAGPRQQCKKGPSLRTLRKGQLSGQAHASVALTASPWKPWRGLRGPGALRWAP